MTSSAKPPDIVWKTVIDIAEPRKIIQIITNEQLLFSLCNDGTVWVATKEGIWKPLPLIPQDTP